MIGVKERRFLIFSKTLLAVLVQTNGFLALVEFVCWDHQGGQRVGLDLFVETGLDELSDSNKTSNLQFFFRCRRVHFDNGADVFGASLESLVVYDATEKFGFSSEGNTLFQIHFQCKLTDRFCTL